jgi:hypothetical protein
MYRFFHFENGFLNRREAAAQELSSPQSARRFGFRVIFAGSELLIRPL